MKRLIILLLAPGLAWSQYRPRASETDKPAVFGYMILARSGEMRGNSISSVYAQSVLPYLACAVLFPVYWKLSRRWTVA